MVKKNKGLMILTSLIILLPMLAGILLWDQLPEKMAIHWGANGEANGWTSRPVAVFGLPLFLLVIHFVGIWGTDLDKRNRNQNEKIKQITLWIAPAVSLLGNSSTYAAAMGQEMDIVRYATLFMGLVFLMIGNYMPKCKQNYTIGIKLKWTLESEENWYATHRLAGKIWMAGGLGILACGFFSVHAPVFVLFLLMVFIPVIYSWRYSKR